MKKNEIHGDKNLSVSERLIFLWMNDFIGKDKEICKSFSFISKKTSIGRRILVTHIKSLIKKGYIKKTTTTFSKIKPNCYALLK